MKTYEQSSIVAVGAFNPAIFHPAWFKTNKILPSAEVDVALERPRAGPGEGAQPGLVVSREATQVRFESMLLLVTPERWELSTERPDWKKDLGPIVSSVFETLGHTPVKLLGFNVIVNQGVRSPEAVMNRWAPVSALARVVGDENPEVAMKVGAMVRGSWSGYRVAVAMEPSTKLEDRGVFVSQNFEKTIEGGAKELVEVTRCDWERILKRAEDVVTRLLGDEP